MKSNLFITGGSGLLALNWALFTRRNCQVSLGLHRREITMATVNTEQVALDDESAILRKLMIKKPDLVIHTAGLTNVEKCESSPDLAYHVNVELAINVAKACEKLNIPLVHISTDHLFSGDHAMVGEEEEINPVNVYAKTKGEAEKAVLEINKNSLIIRTNFYGWGPSYRNSFSDVIFSSLSQGKRITLFDDVFYTPIYTSVLVGAVHKLVQQYATGIFNVTGDERVSKYQFGKLLAEKFDLDSSLIIAGSISDNSNLKNRPKDMSLSNRKVCKLIGQPLGTVEEHLSVLQKHYQSGLVKEIINL